jgi:hypothetical protein
MSFNTCGFAYNVGFRNPIEVLLRLSLAALMMLTIDAKTGVAALVPKTVMNVPSSTTT